MLINKIFFSVITKNPSREILTKDLVTFKRYDRVKDEKLYYFGFSLKNPTFRGWSSRKIKIEGRIF